MWWPGFSGSLNLDITLLLLFKHWASGRRQIHCACPQKPQHTRSTQHSLCYDLKYACSCQCNDIRQPQLATCLGITLKPPDALLDRWRGAITKIAGVDDMLLSWKTSHGQRHESSAKRQGCRVSKLSIAHWLSHWLQNLKLGQLQLSHDNLHLNCLVAVCLERYLLVG
jgi:hypothetical protein